MGVYVMKNYFWHLFSGQKPSPCTEQQLFSLLRKVKNLNPDGFVSLWPANRKESLRGKKERIIHFLYFWLSTQVCYVTEWWLAFHTNQLKTDWRKANELVSCAQVASVSLPAMLTEFLIVRWQFFKVRWTLWPFSQPPSAATVEKKLGIHASYLRNIKGSGLCSRIESVLSSSLFFTDAAVTFTVCQVAGVTIIFLSSRQDKRLVNIQTKMQF